MVLYQVSQVLSLGREGCEKGMVPVETLGVDMVSKDQMGGVMKLFVS